MEHGIEIIFIVMAQIIAVAVYVVTTRERIAAVSKRVDAHDQGHRDHYSHAADRVIHQESMDAKLVAAEFHAVKTLMTKHSDDDLRNFNEIKNDIRELRGACDK